MNPVLCQLRKLIARADDLIDIVYPPEPPIPPTTLEAALLLLIPTAGLFKDVAGTIPATVAGDKIAAWKDMRNGLMFTQATVANQPVLAFVSGKPVVRFDGVNDYLVLTNNFAGITVNSSAVFGYYTTDATDYTVFDGPNNFDTITRYSPNGLSYSAVFLGARLPGWMAVPASGKMVMSVSRQEASYNGRINGAQIISSAVQALNNSGNKWQIGVGVGGLSYLAGDIFGIAIYSTPAGTSHATHIAGVTEIENYISTFYPEAVATLDWNPASGAFASTIGPTPVFSRASAATMIDVTGKVVWGPENLLLKSSDFSTTWTADQISVVPNAATSPDGSMTADKLVESTGNAPHLSYQLVTSTPGAFTFSVYLKAGERTKVQIFFAADHGVNVDLAAGTLGSAVGVPAGTSITPAGNGWHRVSVTYIQVNPQVYPIIGISTAEAASRQSYLGDGVSGIYAWGAQLERGSVARTYLPTTTAPVYGPRITYDPISHQCLGYLAEEQRTNLALHSTDLSNAVWSKGNTTLANTISPDGSSNAWMLTTTQAGSFVAQYNLAVTPGASYSFSFWAKRGTMTAVKYRVYDLTNSAVIVAATDFYSRINASSWTRVAVTFVVPAGCTSIAIYPIESSGVIGTVEIWGAQLEAGFPTSYIPTTTAAVTRSADLCSISGTDFTGFYNQTEGTIVADARTVDAAWYRYVVAAAPAVSDGTNEISFRAAPGNGWSFLQSKAPGAASVNRAFSNPLKAAAAFNATDVSVSYGGGAVQTAAGVGMASMTQMSFGLQSPGGGFFLNGTIARIQYFPTRLPNAKLIELTTPPTYHYLRPDGTSKYLRPDGVSTYNIP